jgi:hypothetical protein
MSEALHGIVAVFPSPETFLAALRRVREAGYESVEVNVPFAVEGMDEWLPGRPTPIARIILIAGLTGAAGAYFLQWYAAHDYPLNIGGRPLHSWPAFIPVTFELMVLSASLVGVGALLWLTGLPRLDHPLFAIAEFSRASQDRYFIGVRANDPQFQIGRVQELLASLAPELIAEVRA